MKRLALFLDGTWNDPDDEANVHALSEASIHRRILLSGRSAKASISKHIRVIGYRAARLRQLRHRRRATSVDKKLDASSATSEVDAPARTLEASCLEYLAAQVQELTREVKASAN
jgi:hypothetical protein